MGKLNDFNLSECMEKFGTTRLVETGTGAGNSLRYALTFPFTHIDSCEIIDAQAQTLKQIFSYDKRVRITAGNSAEFLRRLLPTLDPHMPILFYLDAHYPGSDLGIAPYEAEKDIAIRLPLESELEIIASTRTKGIDVLIVDDLRIYAKGPYESKNLDEIGLGHIGLWNGAHFVWRLFEKTHAIEHSARDTGYLILTPKIKI